MIIVYVLFTIVIFLYIPKQTSFPSCCSIDVWVQLFLHCQISNLQFLYQSFDDNVRRGVMQSRKSKDSHTMASRKGTKGLTIIYKSLKHYNLSNMNILKTGELNSGGPDW